MEEFNIEKELGKGQFGEVYLVSSLIDQKFYAMKKIPISPTNQLHNKQHDHTSQAISWFHAYL